MDDEKDLLKISVRASDMHVLVILPGSRVVRLADDNQPRDFNALSPAQLSVVKALLSTAMSEVSDDGQG